MEQIKCVHIARRPVADGFCEGVNYYPGDKGEPIEIYRDDPKTSAGARYSVARAVSMKKEITDLGAAWFVPLLDRMYQGSEITFADIQKACLEATGKGLETESGPPSEPIIQLPQSRLMVQDGFLYRKSTEGRVIARHTLSEIRQVKLSHSLDKVCLVCCAIAGVAAYVAWAFIPSAGWRWGVMICCITISFLLLIGSKSTRLQLDQHDGSVAYPLSEDSEDVQGFFLSLNEILRSTRRR